MCSASRIKTLVRDRGEITITVTLQTTSPSPACCVTTPRLKFEQLIDLCGVDYSDYRNEPREGLRYCVVSHLLSVTHNWRVRLKVFAPDDELPAVASLTEVWASANWFEREAFDLYGIIFEGHVDLRRILTDYGFIGHPMRKDFPVTGNVEMRYDAEKQARDLPAGDDRAARDRAARRARRQLRRNALKHAHG